MRKIILAALCIGLVSAAGLGLAAGARPAAAASNGNYVVQTIPGPTVAQKLKARTETSWPWYLTRASGLVAAAALIVLILSGIGQITGYTFRLLDPLTSWASHRALGLAFGIAVFVHMFSLLFDHFVSFRIVDILVPWASSYRPVEIVGLQLGSLYVALGVIAFYLVQIIIVSSLLWVEKKPQSWKWLHLLSYVVILLVFVHALYIGTDLAHGLLRLLWIASGCAILLAAMQRLWRIKTS